MKKYLLSKLLILLLIIFTFTLFIFPCDTKAAYDAEKVNDEPTQSSNTEEELLMYDSITGETTTINMDEVRQNIALFNDEGGSNYNRTESYDPYNASNSGVLFPRANIGQYYPSPTGGVFPCRVTCRIKYDVYGQQGIATGFLVGPNLLLTAAHCVMNVNDSDRTFADWCAYPGYNNGSSYLNVSSGWSQIIYPNSWISDHPDDSDWCLCILNESIGLNVGWYGCQAYGTNSEMNGIMVSPYGYPQAYGNGEKQYYTFGNISNTHDKYFDTNAVITGGMSGGPIARSSDNYAVGLVKGFYKLDSSKTYAVRITQQIIDLINSKL